MTLQDLTGQESGILIYPDGEAFILNWSDYGEQCLPYINIGNRVLPLPTPKAWRGTISAEECENILDELPEGLSASGGKVYTLCNGVRVIAPYEWN